MWYHVVEVVSVNLDNRYKMAYLDDIFLGTKESQGIRNATNAVKFVLFDDVSVLPPGLKFNSKYEFISSKNDGRLKAKQLSAIDLIEILCKYAMSSFGLENRGFSINYQDYENICKNIINREYTSRFAVEIMAFACTENIYQAYTILLQNKDLKMALVDSLLTERYIENRRLMLDRFDGVIISEEMAASTKEKFIDSFKSLEEYFYNIKIRSQDYLNYLENN